MHDKILGAHLPSVMALAYLGDAVHSLYVREMLVKEGISKSGELNARAREYVTAEKQREMYERISDMLLDDERDVFRRASNSTHLSKPKHRSGADYRCATGFEAVLGMLYYIKDTERLELLMKAAHTDTKGEENDTEN